MKSHPPHSHIDLHIEELVLDGFPVADRQLIGDSFRAELVRLLGESGLPAGESLRRRLPGLPARPFTVNPGARPEAVGMQAAQAVYQTLSAAPTHGSSGEDGHGKH